MPNLLDTPLRSQIAAAPSFSISDFTRRSFSPTSPLPARWPWRPHLCATGALIAHRLRRRGPEVASSNTNSCSALSLLLHRRLRDESFRCALCRRCGDRKSVSNRLIPAPASTKYRLRGPRFHAKLPGNGPEITQYAPKKAQDCLKIPRPANARRGSGGGAGRI